MRQVDARGQSLCWISALTAGGFVASHDLAAGVLPLMEGWWGDSDFPVSVTWGQKDLMPWV